MKDTILLTGASGALGRQITKGLSEAGYRLRLTDIKPFPDPVPPGAEFIQADLVDAPAILKLAEGCKTILHFGGVSVERPFNEIIGPNIAGLFHIYEAARAAKARVVFASSNHAIGFHPRSEPLDADCALKPDGYYGLSKAYGELMGGVYFEKHAVESVHIRIGSSLPAPVDARMLSTYLSYADLVRLLVRCIEAPVVGNCVIWALRRIAARSGMTMRAPCWTGCRRIRRISSRTRWQERRAATPWSRNIRAGRIRASITAARSDAARRRS